MAFGDALDNLQGWFDGLNQREKRLLAVMAAVFAVLVIVVPIYFGISSISDLETENREIAQVLQDIYRSEGRLQQQKAERRAVERLYTRTAPSLGSFFEEEAKKRNLTDIVVKDPPDVQIGQYTRRAVRVSVSRVQLYPFIQMLADIKNSRYPVAIGRIEIQGGARRGGYSATVVVNAYDRESGPSDEED